MDQPRHQQGRRTSGDAAGVELACGGCSRRFRVRPIGGQPLPDTVPCPRCEAPITVRAQQDLGWKRRDISSVFHPQGLARRAPTPEATRPSGGADKPKRVFQDVSTVGGLFDEPVAARPTEPPADTHQLDFGGLAEADAGVEGEVEGKIAVGGEPTQHQGPGAGVEAPSTESPAPRTAHRTPRTEDRSPAGPPPAAAFPLAAADHEGPWQVRVNAIAYGPIDDQTLAEILKADVWLDAIEIATADGAWIPLRHHPAYRELTDRLARQTQETVERITSEFDRQEIGARRSALAARPDAAAETPEPAPPSEAPTPAPTTKPRVPDRRSLPLKHALAAGAAIVIGVGTAALVTEIVDDPAEGSAPGGARPAAAAAVEPGLERGPSPAEVAEAMAAAQEGVARAEAPARLARAFLHAERYDLARRAAIFATVEGADDPELQEIFDAAVARDPALHPEVVTMTPAGSRAPDEASAAAAGEPIDEIRALGGGRSISLRLKRGGKNVYAFKPAQTEWEDGWRAEIAADVFCRMLDCPFVVPDSRPARISRADFEALYSKITSPKQTEYAERFTDLQWVRERGPDGVERDYLYGVLKDWVPHFTDWPIEYTEIWQPWLDATAPQAVLDEPLMAAVAGLKPKRDGEYYWGIYNERGEATTRQVARQLSDLLVFDYLTQNWDRFSGVEDYYGVNNQFADGVFVSLDNGAAFYPEPAPDVEARLAPVSRFDRRFITAIRLLRPEVVDAALFADDSTRTHTRLDLFWQQRDKLLRRVDRLVAEHGADRVYSL